VEGAPADRAAGGRYVDRLGGQTAFEGAAAERQAALLDRLLDRLPDDVRHCADSRSVFRRQAADPAQDGREAALPAQHVELDRLQRGHVLGARDPRQRVIAGRLEIAGQISQIHWALVLGITNPRASVDVEGSVGALIPGRLLPPDYAPRTASTIRVKVPASRMATSARTLRSSSMSAFFRPAMNAP